MISRRALVGGSRSHSLFRTIVACWTVLAFSLSSLILVVTWFARFSCVNLVFVTVMSGRTGHFSSQWSGRGRIKRTVVACCAIRAIRLLSVSLKLATWTKNLLFRTCLAIITCGTSSGGRVGICSSCTVISCRTRVRRVVSQACSVTIESLRTARAVGSFGQTSSCIVSSSRTVCGRVGACHALLSSGANVSFFGDQVLRSSRSCSCLTIVAFEAVCDISGKCVGVTVLSLCASDFSSSQTLISRGTELTSKVRVRNRILVT